MNSEGECEKVKMYIERNRDPHRRCDKPPCEIPPWYAEWWNWIRQKWDEFIGWLKSWFPC